MISVSQDKIQALRREVTGHKSAIRYHKALLRNAMSLIKRYELELKNIGITLEIKTRQKGEGENHGPRTPP